MMPKIAVATLLYSVDYLPGVFTLGYQLQKLRGDRDVVLLLLVSRELYQGILSELSMGVLRELYSEIVIVDAVEGIAENQENLKLLKRPELYFTLVKARLWELQYGKVLYLDADTLPLSSDLFNLFEEVEVQPSEVAGAPDVGWPDMFNSGVLLLVPDAEIARQLRQFIKNTVSLDGADQGILNQFFNANCHRGVEDVEQKWIRLPFVHNVTMPNYGYESSPATKFFQPHIKLVHFIGENKPWRDWRGGENDYSNHWNEVYLEFQAECGLIPYMERLDVQSSPSPWKESLEENKQVPERVFQKLDDEQPMQEPERGGSTLGEEEQETDKQVAGQEPERVFLTRDKKYQMSGSKVAEDEPERVFPTHHEECQMKGKQFAGQEPERVFPTFDKEDLVKAKTVARLRPQKILSAHKDEKEDEERGYHVQKKVTKQTKTVRRKTLQASAAEKRREVRSSSVERVFPEDS